MKKIVLISAVVVVAIGAYLYIRSGDLSISGPKSIDPKNSIFSIDGVTIKLNNGISEVESASGSASKIVTKYFGNEATGDLNGDGLADIAFLVTQETGGSGTFFYLAVALKTSYGYQGTNAIFLGDRIAPQNTEIRNGLVIANYAERAKGEPMTARPSVGVSKYIKVVDGKLVETPNP